MQFIMQQVVSTRVNFCLPGSLAEAPCPEWFFGGFITSALLATPVTKLQTLKRKIGVSRTLKCFRDTGVLFSVRLVGSLPKIPAPGIPARDEVCHPGFPRFSKQSQAC